MSASESNKSFTERGIPTHQQLVVPVLKAMHVLGGSARANEITEHVLELVPGSEDLQQITYPTRPNLSVLIDRIGWARTTAKRIGVLEQPGQGMYLLTDKGEELLELTEVDAFDKVQDLDREISRAQRQRKKLEKEAKTTDSEVEDDISDAEIREDSDDEEMDRDWKSQLLERLHQLSPDGFEKFVIYLLRRQGLHLQQTGGSGDEGVDAIGTAPISSVLSSRVAVQVKRYAPDKPIGRDTVALFQRDAHTKGAERAIIVTLSRFTEPARKAATASVPTVDLISGDRLAELIRADGESGVKLRPTVDLRWFDKFD
ncbi:restriction endonuclease [Corynebacterium sp. MSK297]|uniref:restriction endonuclease n=1 Tax=Corynebacterium sp. MSK297 TaxID=3050221 RepID=UPI00255038EF|nr:restriction endonuclease [Corynebacterium sp. MSK297]MDK8846755.1 restriction endonuclease [Corynebacterium sp. MSK297]